MLLCAVRHLCLPASCPIKFKACYHRSRALGCWCPIRDSMGIYFHGDILGRNITPQASKHRSRTHSKKSLKPQILTDFPVAAQSSFPTGNLQPIYVGLNKNSAPHRLICLTSWSSVGGIVWEGLGRCGLGEVCHWWQTWRFQKTCSSPTVLSASFCGF